jgi:hypothetical protein
MAEINKLSVGKVLDKLRSNDAPKKKIMQLDEKVETINESRVQNSSIGKFLPIPRLLRASRCAAWFLPFELHREAFANRDNATR